MLSKKQKGQAERAAHVRELAWKGREQEAPSTPDRFYTSAWPWPFSFPARDALLWVEPELRAGSSGPEAPLGVSAIICSTLSSKSLREQQPAAGGELVWTGAAGGQEPHCSEKLFL